MLKEPKKSLTMLKEPKNKLIGKLCDMFVTSTSNVCMRNIICAAVKPPNEFFVFVCNGKGMICC